MQLFRGCGEQFPLVLELKDSPAFPHAIGSAGEIFDRLENL